jgi:hypothetical protein
MRSDRWRDLASALAFLVLLWLAGNAHAQTRPLAQRRVPNMSVVVTRGLRAEIERSAVSPTSIAESAESPIASRLALPWHGLQQPAWSNTVPDWLVKDAVNYRRRGLPLVHLWQSTHYQLALGLSNHRVPGIYLMQKVP